MTSAADVQSNFSAGEWSPSKQGRYDDQRYKAALATCLNYVPCVEENLKPRSGFHLIGASPRQAAVDLVSFRFSSHNAYVLEYTSDAFIIPSANLRIWGNGALIIADKLAFTAVSHPGTPTFTMSQNFPAIWGNDAFPTCLIHFDDVYGMEKAPHLVGRDFILQITGANTCTLADISSGSTITTAVTGTFTGSIYLCFQMRYKPTTLPFQPVIGGHKILEYTTQTLSKDGTIASVPDQRAILLSVFTPPIVFSSSKGVINPKYAEFIDGPYFDSQGPNTPVSVSGTSGNITVGLFPYVSTMPYPLNSIASDGSGNGFVSLVDRQVGNALPGVASADWALLPIAWNSGTTYALGQAALGDPTNGTVPTVYYSLTASNTNHPLTDTAHWSTVAPAWLVGTTYGLGVVVSHTGTWVSIQAGNVGNTPGSAPTFWVRLDDPQNTGTGFSTAIANTAYLFTSTDASDTLLASDNGFPGVLLGYENTGRLIRLKVAPRPWDNLTTYAQNDLVTFEDLIYKSLVNSNLNHQPDTDVVNWAIQTTTIQWTWGIIKTYTNQYTATVTIKGDDLANNNTIYEYQLGLYSATTGWPNVGAYHEGRVVLACAAAGVNVIMGVHNRFDCGQPDQGLSFSPTAPDGTVTDGNGIAATMNSDKSEVINSMKSSIDGIIINTDVAEWVCAASNLNDPLTPTSVQVKRATKFSSMAADAVTLPSAHAFIQNGGRRLIEYKSFVDITAYQVRPNGSDLTRDCQHLTVNGIASAAYQMIPQPIIWCLTGRMNQTACNEQMDFFPHNLMGIGYTRGPDQTYIAPFSFEHGWQLLSSAINISSMAVQYGAEATRENLYIWRAGGADSFIEMMEPVLDTSGSNSELNFFNQGRFYGELTDANKIQADGLFLDSAIQPSGVKIDSNGGGCTFYGMWYWRGQTVSFVIMGKYIGDYLIANDGSVHIPFSGGPPPNDFAGAFSIADVGLAMVTLPIEHAYGYQEFVYDPNGTSDAVYNYDTVSGQVHPVYKYCGHFGLKYRRRGQTMRPKIGSQNGPLPFGKTIRVTRGMFYVDSAVELNIGTDFSNMRPITLTQNGSQNITPTGIQPIDQFGDVGLFWTTGIFRDFAVDDYSFNGQIAWEQDLPYPGGILAVGSTYEVIDV